MKFQLCDSRKLYEFFSKGLLRTLRISENHIRMKRYVEYLTELLYLEAFQTMRSALRTLGGQLPSGVALISVG